MTAYVPGITETDLKKIVLAMQQLAAGRSNAVGTVTLVTGRRPPCAPTANCAAGSTPLLTPVDRERGDRSRQRHHVRLARSRNGAFTITPRQFRHAGAHLSLCHPRLNLSASTRTGPRDLAACQPAAEGGLLPHRAERLCRYRGRLLAGRSLLWMAWNGRTVESAAATILINSETGKVCVITACGGSDMKRWLPLIDRSKPMQGRRLPTRPHLWPQGLAACARWLRGKAHHHGQGVEVMGGMNFRDALRIRSRNLWRRGRRPARRAAGDGAAEPGAGWCQSRFSADRREQLWQPARRPAWQAGCAAGPAEPVPAAFAKRSGDAAAAERKFQASVAGIHCWLAAATRPQFGSIQQHAQSG